MMEVNERPSERHYRFGPRNQRGFLVGVRWEQATLLAVALVSGVVLVRSGTSELRFYEAFGLVVVAIPVSFWPIRGRTVQQWLPVVSSFVALGLSGRHRARFRSEEPQRGRGRGRSFVKLTVIAASSPSGPIGVLQDRSRNTVSGVIRLRGDAYLLLDAASRQQIADAWSSALGAIAQQPGLLFRLSWIERTVPDHAMRVGERAIASFNDGADGRLVRARQSYMSLLEQEARGVLRHECHLVVTVLANGRSTLIATEQLTEVLQQVDARWSSAGIETEGALSPSGLRTFLARGFAGGAVIPAGEVDLPLSFVEEWDALRTDGTWHATFWVAEWPRLDVGSDFLLPFLLESGFRRSCVVVMQPRHAISAVREAERARTEHAADLDLRRRHGFSQTARSAREHDAVLRRERELAAGHGAFRFGGYLTVTSTSRDGLERDCARAEQAASRSHLVVRRLYGAQREAASFVLPLGRGL